MGRVIREPLPEEGHTRRPDLVRPVERRPDFKRREAQRHLKERERAWAPVAYTVCLAAVAAILFLAYSSYVFSRYRGVILPGVQVDQLRLGGKTEKQAENLVARQLSINGRVPVALTYGARTWKPHATEIGFSWFIPQTAKGAYAVGRKGSIIQQWIDRLPFHPTHYVPLLYQINDRELGAYLQGIAHDPNVNAPSRPAQLLINASTGYHVRLLASRPGTRLDVAAAVAGVHHAAGSLSVPSVPLQIFRLPAAIPDSAARQVQARVEKFLRHPPVIAIGKRVMVTNRATFGPMFSFTDEVNGRRPTIKLNVDQNRLQQFVSGLAQQVDRPAVDARLDFSAGQVRVIQPQRNGRSLNRSAAFQKLLPIVTSLKPNARLHFRVQITQPPIDQSNPATLGIRQLIGVGETSFTGAGPTRFNDIVAIAKALNDTIIPPTGDISFNYLVTPNWLDRVYNDHARRVGNQLVPAGGGAMQQVATTFLRALYASGLKLEERHAHVSRLPWYEPPIGEDAVVAPGRNWDLRFANSTHRYLLLETRVEPVRQELYIYVYGPKLGWHVSVDTQGKVLKVYRHGPQIERVDPSLAPGQVRQISWAADGADVVVQRTIAYPNGNVTTDQIATHYQPSQAIIAVGSSPTPTPRRHAGTSGRTTPTTTPTATTTAVPSPTPTATLSH